MTFANPEYFALFIFLPLVIFWYWKKTHRGLTELHRKRAHYSRGLRPVNGKAARVRKTGTNSRLLRRRWLAAGLFVIRAGRLAFFRAANVYAVWRAPLQGPLNLRFRLLLFLGLLIGRRRGRRSRCRLRLGLLLGSVGKLGFGLLRNRRCTEQYDCTQHLECERTQHYYDSNPGNDNKWRKNAIASWSLVAGSWWFVPWLRATNGLRRNLAAIGIGGTVTRPPLPHHRTCGSAYGGSAG